ncbi:glycoside hydrolase family 38 C-terminal domain-containing protein [Paenibacillus sp. GCM10023252]|uniref:glycoside hydrolase family 38 N-terminal domain-containing protein n=1 Tax=Paenibacillus sp. GCM10023252 TaxID=3252649 RepID=UPI0036143C77
MTNQKYWVVGNTHVDLAWKKNRDEMIEVFDTLIVRVLDVLDSHPTFTYTIEQAAHYRLLEKRRPDLFARVKAYVQEGRLEMVGGMASTLETNFPNGECFVRNQLIGLRWVEEHLGVQVRTPWLIDTFGINAQVPQLLRGFGFDRLMANRFGGKLNEDVFIAEGIDGTKLLIVGMDVYSPYVKHGHLYWKFVKDWAEVDRLFERAANHEEEGPILITAYTENEVLPSLRPDVHIARGNAEGREGTWQYSTYSAFFDVLQGLDKKWPVHQGDLNPEFTGTFSQRIAIRLRNRQVETKLLEAEKWATLTGLEDWQAKLDEAWWELAYIQFHDVFTGSHPTEVYVGLMESLDEVGQLAEEVLERALTVSESRRTPLQGSSGVQVFNSLPWERSDLVVLPLDEQLSGVKQVMQADRALPFDVKDGQLRFQATVPSVGSSVITIEHALAQSSAEGGEAAVSEETGVSGEGAVNGVAGLCGQSADRGFIENEYMRLECDTITLIKRLVWKETGAVLIEDAHDLLAVQRDHGSFQIEELHGEPIPASVCRVQLLRCEETALGSRVVLRGSYPAVADIGGEGFLRWEAELELRKGRPALDVSFRVNWQGEGSRLRFNLPTKLATQEGIYEIPFGTVRRKPYRVRGTAHGEWPAHRFVTIEDGQHGIAVINTGAAGVEVSSGALSTTLLRAPKSEYAGMIIDHTSSQHGVHHFPFVIVPYSGSWVQSSVVQLAQETNERLTSKVYNEQLPKQGEAASWLRLSPGHVVLSAVKRPESGADELLIRLYETAGLPAEAELWVLGAVEATRSSVREDDTDERISCSEGTMKLSLQPFEITTVRITRIRD